MTSFAIEEHSVAWIDHDGVENYDGSAEIGSGELSEE